MNRMQQLETALVKAHRAGDTRGAQAIAAEIKRLRAAPAPKAKPKAKPRNRGTGVGALDTTLDVINEALIGIPEGAYNAAAMITDPLAGLIVGKKTVAKAQKQRKEAVDTVARTFVTKPRPIAREVGRTVGPGAAVSRTATLAVPLLQKAPVVGNALARIAKTTASGGLGTGRTAAQTAALTKGQRIAQLGERMVGGAISGGATAGLTGQDVSEGALFGAGLPVAADIVKRLGGRAVDLFRVPKLKAAEIIREALGNDVEATRQVLSQLSPDDQRLAQRVMIDAGLEPRAFFGLGKSITEQVDPDTTARVLAQEAAAREAALADISGGGTATQRRAAIEAAGVDVSGATGPAREQALGMVKATNRIVSDADALATAARQRAAEQSDLARRMTFGAERAETALGQMDDLGDPFAAEAINRQRGLAGAMTQRGETAALGAIGQRQGAQDIDFIVAQIASQGREPLLAAPLSNALRQQANAEGVRTSSARRALLKLANQIDGAADQNGMLNPYDLYTLRKEASDIVEKYVASSAQPSTGSKKRAAGLVIGFKNAVDDALGPEFKDYLTQHRMGMEAVNRQELASKGAQLAKENPNEFIALMGGERPQIVEDIMGKGTKQYDIGGLALMDPRRYNTMMNASRELQALNRMRELGTEGSARAADIMRAQQPGLMERGVGLLLRTKFPSLSFATTGAQNVETATVSPLVRARLANAFASGQGMREAMEQYPTAFNISEQVSRVPAGLRNVMAQGLVRPITADFPEIDPETGEILLEVGFNEDGSTYPIYGRPPAR
jgi:hypothetical protein